MNWWLGKASGTGPVESRPWLPVDVRDVPAVEPDPRGRIGFRNSGSYMGEDEEVVPPEFAAECAAEGGE